VNNSEQIYKKYSNLVGSEFIASPKALRIIEKQIDKFIVKHGIENSRVIEIGTGIGTIAELITYSKPGIEYFAFERDAWCIEELTSNLSVGSIQLFTEINTLIEAIIQDESRASLLIVDDFLNEHETNYLVQSLLNTRLVLLIEGHRFRQRYFFAKSLLNSKTNFYAKFYGNSRDSVKGAFFLVTISRKNVLKDILTVPITVLTFMRIRVQGNLYSRKILQWIGIRKRWALNHLPRLSRRS
jgi:hypothetical protein